MNTLDIVLEALGAFTALCTLLHLLLPGKVGEAAGKLGLELRAIVPLIRRGP